MKENLTELVFILDRSGSMGGLEADTIGGYNAMLKKQQAVQGQTLVTTVLFDDKYELLHDRMDLSSVSPITEAEYYVRGSTALLDAVGMTISKIEASQKHTAEANRAEKVLFVITTDGMENASREYSYKHVAKLIHDQKEVNGWEFIFLGANIDAVKTAGQLGISADRAANYHSDSAGTQLNFAVLSEAISDLRASRPLTADWKKRIDEDFKARNKDK